MGYHRAGFDVTGVDIAPQPRYPFEFVQAEGLEFLDGDGWKGFDVIHSSPPCQRWSHVGNHSRAGGKEYPDLISPTRRALLDTGLPFVIENVPGSPLLEPLMLCGTMFDGLRVLRHRLFEANFPITCPPHGKHPLVHTLDKRKNHYGKTDDKKDYVQVTGGGNCSIAAARDAMGIDWMTKGEINEAIPPAYTKFIGLQMMKHLAKRVVR